MLKQTITYEDLDGNEHVESFFFNMTKAELTELELTTPGGFTAYLNRIAESQNPKDIIETFKNILKMSYGLRSADGKRFIKSEEAWEEFTQTNAYDKLFMRLCTEADFAANFVKAMLPQDMAAQVSSTISKSDVPATLQNHSSMQGHLTRREAREAEQPKRETDSFDIS